MNTLESLRDTVAQLQAYRFVTPTLAQSLRQMFDPPMEEGMTVVSRDAALAVIDALTAALPPQGAAVEPVDIEQPEFHSQGMGCGLEDRGITDRYEAMEYGFNQAIEQYAERIENAGPLYATPQPAALNEHAGNSGQLVGVADHWCFAAAEGLRIAVGIMCHDIGPTGRTHLLSMLDQMSGRAMSSNKANRWLGWIQCALVTDNKATLESMKAHNLRYSAAQPASSAGEQA